ncbi:MAG: hypothetical protein VXB01_16920, partial [Opitutae bacterium]
TQINPEDVAANSDTLIEALRPANERVASTARSTKQNQLGSFLQSMGATREVRQSLTEAGELRGIYGDIPFMVEMGLEKGEKEALVRNLVRDNSEFFGLESEDQIASVSVDCVGGDCTAHIEKQYAGLQAPGHQLALSFGADSIHAIIGKFEPPKISLQRIPDRLSPKAVVAELASHLGRSSDQIAAGEAVVEQTIESLGVIDFFAERWEGVWIGAQPYEVIINSATVKVVAVIPLVKQVQVDASGEDLFGNRRSFNAEKISETSYLMKDEGFPENYETLVMDFEGLDFEEIKKRVNNGQMQLEDIKLVTSASPSSGWDPAAVSLLTSTREAIAYYWDSHEYRAVNEDGANLNLAINSFGGNAGMWGDYLAEYGVGTGRIAGEGVSFARAKDVVGHEITHGVIAATSGLVYADQSGALNE